MSIQTEPARGVEVGRPLEEWVVDKIHRTHVQNRWENRGPNFIEWDASERRFDGHGGTLGSTVTERRFVPAPVTHVTILYSPVDGTARVMSEELSREWQRWVPTDIAVEVTREWLGRVRVAADGVVHLLPEGA